MVLFVLSEPDKLSSEFTKSIYAKKNETWLRKCSSEAFEYFWLQKYSIHKAPLALACLLPARPAGGFRKEEGVDLIIAINL